MKDMPHSAAGWIDYLESLSPPQAIQLGLARMQAVLRRIGWGPADPPALVVGGTNGKGSTVAFLEAMLRQAGYRVGAYFSPHLRHYAERIRIDGVDIDEASLCRAFAAAEEARGDLPLTFFEFGTVAALLAFRAAPLDCLVLEVGLGGRLDAVNAVDPIAAAVTSVGIDHVEWLGPDRESIGREKAGIFRSDTPAVVGDPAPPASLIGEAGRIGARLVQRDRDFGRSYPEARGPWTFWSQRGERADLPAPALGGDFQLDNASTALALLEAIEPDWPVPDEAVRAGLVEAHLPGRFEWRRSGRIQWCLDVAHNPAAGAVLARELDRRSDAHPIHVLLGMMRDKDVAGFVRVLAPVVATWHPIGLPAPRGLAASELAARVRAALPCAKIESADPLGELLVQWEQAEQTPLIVVTGSFRTLESVLPQMAEYAGSRPGIDEPRTLTRESSCA